MKRIAVLRGGPSEEYDVSMLTGKAVLEALGGGEYAVKDIMISKTGQWFEQGRKRTTEQALTGVDVVFIALHGSFGEDGQVQRILEQKRIPFTGSPSLASGIALNKELAKHTLRPHKVNMCRHRRVGQLEKHSLQMEIEQIILDLGTELYIKPLRSRSANTYRTIAEAKDLEQNLVEMLDIYDDLLIEQKKSGRSAQVALLSNFRDQELYSFPAFETTSGNVQLNRFSAPVKAELARVAKQIHKAIECSQYSLIDFLINNDDDVVFLKIDTHPELASTANFSHAAESVGLTYRALISHLIETADSR